MRLFREKQVKVNNERIKKDIIINEGDSVIVYTDSTFNPRIIYQDDNIIVFYKPKGIPSIGDNSYDTLVNSDGALHLCHRLDINTDGLIIYAKNSVSYDAMFNAFKKRTLTKTYRALIHGVPKSDAETLKLYLDKKADINRVFISDKKTNNNQELTITSYKVITRYDNHSEVEIVLHTGKTHQIRAVMAHINHPVIGDEKYGLSSVNKQFKTRKQQLTFSKLQFNFSLSSPLNYLNEITIAL